LDFRILGRLEVLDGERDVAPRRAQTRALLALFLLHPNERLTTERISDALWGDEPPKTADKALQGHVSALRKALGAERLQTERGGYRLAVGAGELDLERFTADIAAARTTRQPRERARILAQTLETWRGEPLADLASERFLQPEIARLQELRLAAVEDFARAELELGHHAEQVAGLDRLVAQHPLREGLRGALMLALYRSGRQADALRVYREGRLRLAEELGIEPGSELQRLEQQVLAQDPTLDPPAVGSAPVVARQERKTVTVLVVEVIPANADPEDLERVTAPTLQRIRAVVERLGGTAEPLFANAMVGIFGAPRAHDDDALRAVRAALALVDSAGDGPPILRGGIETGEALVTIEGSDVAVTGHVVGDASRLSATAPLGSILVGAATHRATQAMVDYRSVGEATWSPDGPRRQAAPGVEAPFIGRADELALLERIYARARDERSIQLVTVAAEPGGGKSRLVRELRAVLETSTPAPIWRQGQCLPYGDGVTYWALGEIVKEQAGVLESDDASASAAKLGNAIAAAEPDEARRAWLERSLAPLVGIEGAAAAGEREQSFAAWRQLLEAIASDRPLVAVFEDLHWADDALLEFIEDLVRQASGVPLLVLCTARLELLESRPTWGGGTRNSTTIALEPLSEADTARMLHSLLGRAPESQTIRRAGGNPLYAHELARTLELGGIEAAGTIPESLQAVIAAHLDALAPELKAIASDAAVVGEVFWSGAVAALAGLDEAEVESRLQRLVANDVARRRRASSVARQSEYEFLHVLVRDVAYGQIPRLDRIGRHRAAAAWIEGLAGDRVTAHAELVAYHATEALDLALRLGDADQVLELRPTAGRLLALAGDATRALDFAKAESFYRRALDLTDDGEPARGALLSRLGEVAQFRGRLAEAEQLCRAAIEVLERNGDPRGAGEAMVTLVGVLWRLGRPEGERRSLAGEAIAALERLAPSRELVRAYSRMATHELLAGRVAAVRDWSSKALELAEQLGAIDLTSEGYLNLGIARFELGDLAGIDDVRRAVEIGLASGLSWETATAQSDLAATIWLSEGPAPALEVKRRAIDFAAERGLGQMVQSSRGEMLLLLFDAGLWDELLELAGPLLEWDRERGASRLTMTAETAMAKVLVARGQAHEATALQEDLLARARALSDPQDLVPALEVGAEVLFALGDGPGALALLEELDRETTGRDASRRSYALPTAARVSVGLGAPAVAEALLPDERDPMVPRGRLCVSSARAVFAEAHGDIEAAVELFGVAASGWHTFGCPAEEAHALLGRARGLARLGRQEDALGDVRDAARIARKLGARPLLDAAERARAGYAPA
jgi:DNA-binding SARP family transcriptional activator